MYQLILIYARIAHWMDASLSTFHVTSVHKRDNNIGESHQYWQYWNVCNNIISSSALNNGPGRTILNILDMCHSLPYIRFSHLTLDVVLIRQIINNHLPSRYLLCDSWVVALPKHFATELLMGTRYVVWPLNIPMNFAPNQKKTLYSPFSDQS